MFCLSLGTPMISKSPRPSRPIRTPQLLFCFSSGQLLVHPFTTFNHKVAMLLKYLWPTQDFWNLFRTYSKHWVKKLQWTNYCQTHFCGMSPLKQYFLQLCLVCMATIMSGFHRNCFRRQGTKSILSFSCLIWWGDCVHTGWDQGYEIIFTSIIIYLYLI